MASGLTEYNFDDKNSWRRANWNYIRNAFSVVLPPRVVARLPDEERRAHLPRPPSRLVGIALFGPDAMDLEVAQERGFDPRNIFIAEREPAHAEEIKRQTPCRVIGCDLVDAIENWPADLPLDFILADMVSGFTENIRLLLRAMLRAPGLSAYRCAVIVNLQRGRESPSDMFAVNRQARHCDTAHRGFSFWTYLLATREIVYPSMTQGTAENGLSNPRLASYRSRAVTMDTLRITMSRCLWGSPAVYRESEEQLLTEALFGRDRRDRKCEPSRIRRMIAAARAVRTMSFGGANERRL